MQGGERKKKPGSVRPDREESLCAALVHPIRMHILEILNEGPKSPSQFVEEGLIPQGLHATKQQALSFVAYHFRELAKAGCLEVVETIQRRGATEHVYSGLMAGNSVCEDFTQRPAAERRRLSRISFQGLIARAGRAMQAGTFDSRSDRHLTWGSFGVDARGWREMMAAIGTCRGEIKRVRREAARRLAASGEEAITVTFGQLGFVSPSRPPPSIRD